MTLTPEDHRAIAAEVVALMRKEPIGQGTPVRIQYTIKEFAVICGRTVFALRHRKTWKRYGGIKRGRNVVFPESARLAIAEGKK